MIMKSAFPYVPLGFRSYFSLLKGCLSPEQICRYAREMGFSSVGLADENNFYGLIRFLKAAAREGVKPVVGVDVVSGGKRRFTAYVMNRQGFARINRILTSLLMCEAPAVRRKEEKTYDPAADLLEEGWEGLCLVSDSPSLLDRLRQRSDRNLFVGLTFEKSFIGQARWARSRGLPVIALNDGVYADETDRGIYRILRAIDLNRVVEDVPAAETITSAQRIAGREEMERYFSAVPEALEASGKLSSLASSEGIMSPDFVFPRFEGMDNEESFRYLRQLCLKGVGKRYGALTPPVERRLAYELAIIRRKRFAGYFLVVNDIVSRCPRTCGRGSSASSIVSYLLRITHVDPLRYNLFFERFLNLGRKDPPDIDVDFPWDERDRVFNYVFKRYRNRAGMVANHVTLGPRACIRETAKALGMEEEEIGRLVRFEELGWRDRVPGYIRQAAERIRGFPRYIGTHCGGVVITPKPLTHYTHYQLSPQGYPVIAWEKDATEDAGLVKIDLLGNRSLGVLRDTLSLVAVRHGRRIEWESFNPLEDGNTRRMIEAGRTIGIFYVESPATRQLLKKMRRGDFEHLVIASSIIRPAANVYIREFVERLHKKPYKPLHPKLEGTLKETYGIMVYQEDVSRVAIDIAGFSPEEADRLRKVISKKDRELCLPDFKERFFEGGKRRGVCMAAMEEIWSMILSFKEYSFCKAHSASYALVSYKLAYLKRYYPLEFMVSVINNEGGYYSCQTYLNECKRMGFAVLNPDINRSRISHIPEGNALRIGFKQLRDLRSDFLDALMEERQRGGMFKTLDDFISRCVPGLPEMRILIRSGALDSLSGGSSRPELFWRYFNADSSGGLFLIPPVPRFVGDYSQKVKLLDEVRTLGVIFSRHPLEVFRGRISQALDREGGYSVIDSRDIPRFLNRKVTLAGLLVTGKEVQTRTWERMTFMSFEDPFSIFETVFFPRSFRKFYSIMDRIGIFLLSGRVENDHGALSINVERLVRIDESDCSPVSDHRSVLFRWLRSEEPESVQKR